MTAAALIEMAERAGLTLEARPGGVLHVAPSAKLTSKLREALKVAKPAILAALRARALGLDWSKVSLYQLDRVLEVAVPWSEVPLILAPGCRVARELRAQDATPGRIWCVCEVLDLLLSGVTPADAQAIAAARLQFDAEWAGITRGH